MKLKILLLIAAIAVIGGSIVILLVQAHRQRVKFAPPQDPWPVVMGNYNKTFKLNTAPPLWPEAKGATNGSATN